MRSKKIFDESRQPEIVACIERLENKTSAEIVCAVADESGRYDRAESISYWHGLRRLVTSEKEMAEEANRAACVVFSKASVGSAGNRCGLLLYLSLFERRVVVMADEAVRSALSDERIQQLCNLAVVEIKAGRIETVFETLMSEVEETLVEKLPCDRELDANELENHILLAHRF
jgi:uncharacterized membrane protein